MIPGQPAEAPVVHYVPTRCLTPDAARQLVRLDLAPVEDLSERHVLDSSISRLRAYISLYRAFSAFSMPPCFPTCLVSEVMLYQPVGLLTISSLVITTISHQRRR